MEKSIPVGKDASLLYLSVTSSGNGTQHKKRITHDRKSNDLTAFIVRLSTHTTRSSKSHSHVTYFCNSNHASIR